MRKLVILLVALAITGLQGLQPSLAQPVPANGDVTKVDQAAGKITLRHGPIKNLDMDSMTMVFRVADPAWLKTIKPGDRVRFEAERVNGQITVTSITKLK